MNRVGIELSTESQNDSETEITFAIVGCGRIGNRHASHIRKFGNLAAVCDIDAEAADDLARQTNAEAYYDLSTMLDALAGKADVIAICTPNGLHAAQTIEAFGHGFHVICEKPMALSVSDCGEMIKAGDRANRRLFVVKQNRFNPPVEHLKALIDAGRLGRVFSIQLNCYWNRNDNYFKAGWRGTRDLDGGTLFTQFSHFIDLLYWMFGDVVDVDGFVANYTHPKIEFEDAGVAILRFANGAIGGVNFTINSYGKNMEGSLTVFAEKGTVKIGGQYLNEIEYENVEGLAPSELREGRPANAYGQYTGSMSNHEDVYANVVEVLSNRGSITTGGFEGLKTVEIIESIYRNVRQAS